MLRGLFADRRDARAKEKTEHDNCLDLADMGRSVLRPYTSSVMLQRGFGWAARASLKA